MTTPARISVAEAQSKLGEGYTYVDVRTPEEFSAGHVPGAINVPFALSSGGSMSPNPSFLEAMGAAFPKEARLVVGCKSGGRSLRAAGALAGAGFTGVVELRPGWDGARDAFGQLTEPGWSRSELPVEDGEPAGRSWKDVASKLG